MIDLATVACTLDCNNLIRGGSAPLSLRRSRNLGPSAAMLPSAQADWSTRATFWLSRKLIRCGAVFKAASHSSADPPAAMLVTTEAARSCFSASVPVRIPCCCCFLCVKTRDTDDKSEREKMTGTREKVGTQKRKNATLVDLFFSLSSPHRFVIVRMPRLWHE